MMIRPASGSGRNTAERVPTTTRASPRRQAAQVRARSPSDSPECRAWMGTPRRARNRLSSCGVRPISGTSTNACRSRDRQSLIAFRYTSVLPLPVTPSSRNGANPARAARIASTATCCSGCSKGPGRGSGAARAAGNGMRSARPRWARLRAAVRQAPAPRPPEGASAWGPPSRASPGPSPTPSSGISASNRVSSTAPSCRRRASRRGRPARILASARCPSPVSRHAQPWVSGKGSPRRRGPGSAAANTSPKGAWV